MNRPHAAIRTSHNTQVRTPVRSLFTSEEFSRNEPKMVQLDTNTTIRPRYKTHRLMVRHPFHRTECLRQGPVVVTRAFRQVTACLSRCGEQQGPGKTPYEPHNHPGVDRLAQLFRTKSWLRFGDIFVIQVPDRVTSPTREASHYLTGMPRSLREASR